MVVPLVASPAPVRVIPGSPVDLLVGASSTFNGSNGSWTAPSGGTLTHDTNAAYNIPGHTGSLKLVTTAVAHKAQLVLPGTYRAGVLYHAMIAFCIEETIAYGSEISFYLKFASSAGGGSYSFYLSHDQADAAKYLPVLLDIIPGADVTDMVLEVQRLEADTYGTITVHIGWVRVARVPEGSWGLLMMPARSSTGNRVSLIVPTHVQSQTVFGGGFADWGGGAPKWGSTGWGEAFIVSGNQNSEIDVDNDGMYIGTSPMRASGADLSGEGFDFEVGPAYDGFFISEGDNGETQFHADGAHELELTDAPWGIWYARGIDGRRPALSKVIENPMIASGDFVVGDAPAAITVGHVDNLFGVGQPIRVLSSSNTEVILGDNRETLNRIVPDIDRLVGSITVHYDVWSSLLHQGSSTGVIVASEAGPFSYGGGGSYLGTRVTGLTTGHTIRLNWESKRDGGGSNEQWLRAFIGGSGTVTASVKAADMDNTSYTAYQQDLTLSGGCTEIAFWTTVNACSIKNLTWRDLDGPLDEATLRIRRGTVGHDLTGTVLASQVVTALGEDGHQYHWFGTYVDGAPTTGEYLLTAQITGSATSDQLFSDAFVMYLTCEVAGNPVRFPKGADGTMLAVDPSTHAPTWKDPQFYFQWPFYVPGVLTIGANKAAYFQVPNTCKIDEVRIHVGTAPTDASLIVDVNDDGTTIFTTQANRPEIAISGTDDTSGAADGGTSVAKDSVLTVDIDQVGSSIAGSDLVIFVRGHYIW